jgi:hypothetical protein
VEEQTVLRAQPMESRHNNNGGNRMMMEEPHR